MCLGVPGQVVEIVDDGTGMPMGKVSFGGVLREVCFGYVPEARPGDYVLVHVGFALSVVDEEEAQEIFRVLEDVEILAQTPEHASPPPSEAGGEPASDA